MKVLPLKQPPRNRVTYTVDVKADSYGRFARGESIQITGINGNLAGFQTPRPDYCIPWLKRGQVWATLIAGSAKAGMYKYRYGVVPIGFMAPMVIRRGDVPWVSRAVESMRKHWPRSGSPPVHERVALRLFGSRNYGQWAMGCCMLAIKGGKGNMKLLDSFEGTDPWIPFWLRRYAWLLFTVNSFPSADEIPVRARRFVDAVQLMFAYNESGVLAGADLRVRGVYFARGHVYHPVARMDGWLGRHLDVVELRPLVAREGREPPAAPSTPGPAPWLPVWLGTLGAICGIAVGGVGGFVVASLRSRRRGKRSVSSVG